MFTKENAITLPFMILLYEFCFFKIKKELNWKPLVPFLFIFLIIPLTWFFSEGERVQARLSFATHHISSLQYLLTEFRVIFTYIRLAFLPLNQNLDYDYSLSKSIFELPALFSFIGLIAVLYFARQMFAKYRLISFSILWFFLTLFPESSFFPFGDVIFEHRLYLSLAGYGLFLVSGTYYILGKKSFPAMVIFLGMVIACNSILTYQRNTVWKDEFTLWNDTVQKSPNKARPYNNRGSVYSEEDDLVQAMLDCSKAITLNPNYAEAYYNRGLIYDKQGNFTQALSDYNKAIELNPSYPEAYNNRGVTYANQDNITQSISDYSKAIGLNPNYAEAYNNRGIIYAKKNDFAQAISDFNKAIELNPDSVEIYSNRGNTYDKQKDFTRAISDYNKIIKLDPTQIEAYFDIANVYAEQNNFTRAVLAYTQTIEINPQYALAYNNRAISYYQLKEYVKAWADATKAGELGYDVNPDFLNAVKQALNQ